MQALEKGWRRPAGEEGGVKPEKWLTDPGYPDCWAAASRLGAAVPVGQRSFVKQPHKTLLLWVVLIVAFLAIWQFLNADGPQRTPMPFSDFVAMVRAPKEARHVEAVKIKDREYTFRS
jgi:hypothetical protein